MTEPLEPLYRPDPLAGSAGSLRRAQGRLFDCMTSANSRRSHSALDDSAFKLSHDPLKPSLVARQSGRVFSWSQSPPCVPSLESAPSKPPAAVSKHH